MSDQVTEQNIIQIGQKAPNFTLRISENKEISLSDYKGKFIVLYFYPKDNTPGCSIEANAFNQLISEFTKLNTEVIGVSKDDLKSHDKFRNKYDLNFNLGSDKDGNTCEQYNVWGEKSFMGRKYMGVTRSTFLIDTDGQIVHIWDKVSVTNHANEVLKTLENIQKS